MHADKRLINSLLSVIQHFFRSKLPKAVYLLSKVYYVLAAQQQFNSLMINMIYYFYHNCSLFNSGEDDANLWESGSAVRSKCYT